jgi:hypothetical protein
LATSDRVPVKGAEAVYAKVLYSGGGRRVSSKDDRGYKSIEEGAVGNAVGIGWGEKVTHTSQKGMY